MRQTLILAALAASVLSACSSEPENNLNGGRSGGILSVDYSLAQPRPIEHTIQLTGTLLPQESAELTTQASGKVQSIHFAEGQTVRKGQILLRIDSREWQAQLSRLQAELETARKDLERKKALAAVKGVSEAELEAAQLKVQTAEAQSEEIRVKINHTSVYAPFDGRIGLRFISPGSYISSGDRIATLVQDEQLKLEFMVPERYAGLMRRGQSIYFTTAASDETYEAKVYATEPMINASSRSLSVRAAVSNQEGLLIPGSFADVKVELDSIPDAIMVPTDAIVPELNEQMIYILQSGKATKIQVKTGVRQEHLLQVTQGLSPGDTVILTGLLQLSDGMPARADGEIDIQNSANRR